MDISSQPPATRHRNMVECLRLLATERPDDEALVVVDANGERHFSYAQLDQTVRALAAQLQRQYAPGERALILLDNNEDYVVAFFACLYAGLIAVPAFVPQSHRQQHLARLRAIADDAAAVCLLVPAALREVLALSEGAFGKSDEIYVDEADLSMASHWQQHQPKPDDIAFLQYTSGSTSTPKGVMVSHGNLVANEQFIEDAYSMTSQEVIVSWLPLFHDMGLIGGMLQPFYGGFPLVLMSPAFFLERPSRWLEAISKFGGTVSGGPDFAFRLCLQRMKAKDLEQLNLSSWRVAFSGSEPVRYDTLQQFSQYFEPVGFSASAPYPCYGLAEATLMLSGGVAASGITANDFQAEGLQRHQVAPDADGIRLVACGAAQPGHQLRLFNPASGQPVRADQVGEIWASGPSIALGYWGNVQATKETFVQYDNKRWLRTGDLGFFYQDQLYICGRLKDLIILNGSNYYPQDLEQLIEQQIDSARPGRVTAFPVEAEQGEGLGIAMELSRKTLRTLVVQDFVDELNQLLAPVCRQQIAMVIVLNPGALPKTSSGKLQRSACFKGWQQGTLDIHATWYHGEVSGPGAVSEQTQQTLEPIEDELEQQLADIWADVLGITPTAIGRNSSFIRLGGHSLAATQIASRVTSRFDVTFGSYLLFETPQLKDVATLLKQTNEKARDDSFIINTIESHRNALSAAQQRQWFLWRMEPGSCANQVIASLRLKGQLDKAVLNNSLNALIQRHESLRTVFELDEQGQPVQRFKPSLSVTFEKALSPSHEVAEIAQQWLQQPFDLSHGPLLRAGLIDCSDNDFVLVLVMHHIITDGWSMELMINELFELYRANLAGQQAQLAELPVRYSDYSQWQQQWLNGEQQQQQLQFWQDVLGNDHSVLELPADRPRQAVAQYNEAQYNLQLPESLTQAIRNTALENNATVFVVLMSALQVLLYRYTGQSDIRVGVPVANRQHTQLEPVVGLFVNTLVFRSQIQDALTLPQLLQHVRQQALAAQQNQQLPFEQLVEALQPERSLSHTPLFQVMYNHRQQKLLEVDGLGQLSVEQIELPLKKRAQFELSLDVVELDNGQLKLRFDYAEALFDTAAIEQFAGHFERLLSLMTKNQQQPIGLLPLLDEQQTQKLENLGVMALPVNDLPIVVHQRFEQMAAQTPQSTAVVMEQSQIDYGLLNLKANQLANHLLSVLPKNSDTAQINVGIALERSVDMIVAVLAVLKAGAGYVPLDPAYPEQRLSYMIEDSQLDLILTRSQWQPLFDLHLNTPCLCLEQLTLENSSTLDPNISVHPEQLAYVIYTSGSTGNPKGVAVSHRALSQHLDSALDYIQLQPTDRMLLFATLNFDSCLEQLFCPLVIGACVVLRGETLWDGKEFHQQLLQQQITVVDLTTAYWDMLLQDFTRRQVTDFGQLRQVHVGGEAMSSQSLDLWQRNGWGQARLLNVYGPTEAIVTASFFDCNEAEKNSDIIPIGAALAGRELRVLDHNLSSLPIGVPGELYIGGELLAQGYLHRPGLTAERFVADPFSTQGGRLYRTGDRARWNHNGQLEYLGRNDNQVKIRGFRVEVGEIETLLRRQPEVVEAVVVVEQNPQTAARLLAYVVTATQQEESALERQLRATMLQNMPEYMVPSLIIVVPFIPMTPSGKLDRNALPKPKLSDGLIEGLASKPKSATEQQLAQVWAQLLGLEQVGRDSNFFEAGGHSLMALQLQNQIEQQFHTNISVMDIFQYPTVRKQAEYIDKQKQGGSTAADDHKTVRQNRQQRAQKARAGIRSRVSKRNKVST